MTKQGKDVMYVKGFLSLTDGKYAETKVCKSVKKTPSTTNCCKTKFPSVRKDHRFKNQNKVDRLVSYVTDNEDFS